MALQKEVDDGAIKYQRRRLIKALIHEIYNLCFSYKDKNKLAKMICARIDDTKPKKQLDKEHAERYMDTMLSKWASQAKEVQIDELRTAIDAIRV